MKNKSLARILFVAVLLAALLPVPAVFAQGGDEIDLAETFTSSDGAMTFDYPSEWVAQEGFIPGMVILATDESTAESAFGESEEPFAAGSMALIILSPDTLPMLFGESGEPESLQDVWDLAISGMDEEIEVSGPEEITLGELSALMGSMTEEGVDETLFVMDSDGDYLAALALTPEGEYEGNADLVLAILETLAYDYVVPEGPQTFTTEDETLTLEYPGGWLALDVMGTVAVTNDRAVMSRDSQEPVESGSIYIFIFRPGVRTLEATDLTDALTQYAELTLQGEEKELAEPEETTLGDYDAVRMDYQTELDEGYLLVVDVDGENMYIQVSTASDELADIEEEVTPILESIVYTAPEGESSAE